jgi:hypothetical protein
MPRGATPGRTLGEEVTQGYAAHPLPPGLRARLTFGVRGARSGTTWPLIGQSAWFVGSQPDRDGY